MYLGGWRLFNPARRPGRRFSRWSGAITQRQKTRARQGVISRHGLSEPPYERTKRGQQLLPFITHGSGISPSTQLIGTRRCRLSSITQAGNKKKEFKSVSYFVQTFLKTETLLEYHRNIIHQRLVTTTRDSRGRCCCWVTNRKVLNSHTGSFRIMNTCWRLLDVYRETKGRPATKVNPARWDITNLTGQSGPSSHIIYSLCF